ncbi:MAG TPA: transcriptional coactivator p15/PC4 family protein [Xanthobacteraceae bacterium]|nr:transcriptional coactivator p15/PC4 family protein [Xanthobacteraceae bacterium]
MEIAAAVPKSKHDLALDSSKLVHEFWANRRGEAVRVQIRNYQGRNLIDLRKFFTGKDGRLRPTKKGLTLSIRKLPDLARGISNAMSAAHELGLIEGVADE